MNRKPRPRKCKVCKVKFQPDRHMQPCCSVKCAIEKTKLDKSKERRKADAEAKRKLKTYSQWFKETQTVFNKWIRLRDEKEPCISCQRFHTGQYHAGHLYSTAARPDIRLHPDNVAKQCSACNTHLSGNAILFKENLIKKIGQKRVEMYHLFSALVLLQLGLLQTKNIGLQLLHDSSEIFLEHRS